MRVLFLIPSVNAGGIETYLLRFLKMEVQEIDATVLVRGNSSGDLHNAYTALGIPVFFMPLGYMNAGRWRQYHRFFKRHEFETICDFNANFAGIPMWLARLAGIKNRIAFYRQGSDHFRPGIARNGYNRLMNRLVYRHATRILANSRTALDYFFPYRRQDDQRFNVIYNGIDLTQYQSGINKEGIKRDIEIPENGFIIGHVGRADRNKNHDVILEVAEELIREDPEVYLVLCGSGTEEFAGQAENRGISENVRLLGFRTDVPDLLRVFDVFYFPSLSEGQPNALLEAMAAGVPVVASNIESIKECMPDAHWKYLAPPYDKHAQMKLIRSIRRSGAEGTPELRRHIGKAFNDRDNFEKFRSVLTG